MPGAPLPKYDLHDLETVRPIMIMSGQPNPPPPANEAPTFEELHKRFREFKHATNNALAIVMALSEMTARNPDHGRRLVQVVAEKGPQIVGQLRELDEWFRQRAVANAANAEKQSPPLPG